MVKKGVSTLEYAVMIAVLVAALIGMQAYIRRAVSAHWRDSADTFGQGLQYEVR